MKFNQESNSFDVQIISSKNNFKGLSDSTNFEKIVNNLQPK